MAWLIAGILAVLLVRTRRRLKQRNESTGETDKLSALIVLRLELSRLLVAGTIDQAEHDRTTGRIDGLWSTMLTPNTQQWHTSRETAWDWLSQHDALPSSLPPWRAKDKTSTEPQRQTQPADSAPNISIQPARLREQVYQKVEVPGLTAQRSSPPATPAVSPAAKLPAPKPTPPPTPAPSTVSEDSYSWKPVSPSLLERTLQTVAGWPAVLAPFLVQNIGWFIGGLCIVAGSIFLVSYLVSHTTGFAKALTIFGVLSAYTFSLLWGGYQLRRRRPALDMSSNALMTLGVLLVPLNIAACVRLLHTAQAIPWQLGLGVLLAVLSLGGLYIAASVVSGVIDRSLQGRHPQLFMALAAIQLVTPLLMLWPYWPVLAFFHLALLGLLAYGLRLFTKDWLHLIFIEQRKIAYYAAGSLVYAALVSFVHLTWGSEPEFMLPAGYASPFLIVVCGLLFWVDAQLKQWTHQYTFLSQLSFGLYGLSSLAIFLAIGAPTAHALSLVLAIGLYAVVTWRYASLPPLYLLLGCSAWLYRELILSAVPYDWYLLAGMPGLVGLAGLSRWALQRWSASLAVVGYRVLVLAVWTLAGWSIVHAEPGLVAMATALIVMAFSFTWPHDLSWDSEKSWWCYAGTFAGTVAAAYAPLWTGLPWAIQYAWSLILVSVGWSMSGLRLYRSASTVDQPRVEALLNSAVLSLGLSLLLAVSFAVPHAAARHVLPLLLATTGGVLWWLSRQLCVQWLFYGALGVSGLAGLITKMIYFPTPGAGVLVLGLALITWAVVWWIEHEQIEQGEISALRQEYAQLTAARASTLRLLWRWSVFDQPYRAIIRTPLQQTMLVLWLGGLAQLGARLLDNQFSWAWVVSAGLGAFVSLVFTGRFRRPSLLTIGLSLGLGAWLVAFFKCGVTTVAGLSVVGAAYALVAWRLGVVLLTHPQVLRLATLFRLGGDRRQLERVAHWTAFSGVVLALVLSLGQLGLFSPHAAVLLTLAIGMAFFWLAGQRYQRQLHSYALLLSGSLGVVLCYAWTFHPSHSAFAPFGSPWQEFLRDTSLGLTLILLSLFLWAVARVISHYWLPESTDTLTDFAHSLYRKPLRIVATRLAVLAAAQQIGLAWPAVIGTGATGGFPSIGVLLLAGISLVLANHALRDTALSLMGILLVTISVVWAQGTWFHGPATFAPWLEARTFADQWLTLSVLAGGLAALRFLIVRIPREDNASDNLKRLYTRPLHLAAALTYSWALLGAVQLFVEIPGSVDALLAWIFLSLALGLFPLLPPWLAVLRGPALALLLSAGVVSVLALGGWTPFDRFLLVVWAYALWGLSNFVLPRFNTRWPDWRIAPETWPWFGLATAGVHFGWWGVWRVTSEISISHLGLCLLALTVYLFLMLRNSAQRTFPWLATLALTSVGCVFSAAWLWSTDASSVLSIGNIGVPLGFVIGSIVWANILLFGVSGWRRYGQTVAAHLGWHPHDLTTPIVFWASMFLCVWLGQLAAVDMTALGWTVTAFDWPSITLIGASLVLSFLRALWLDRSSIQTHALYSAVLGSLIAVWLWGAPDMFHLPLFLALWSLLLLAANSLGNDMFAGTEPSVAISQAGKVWTNISPLFALAVLALASHVPVSERLVSLGILAGITTSLGWQSQQRRWLDLALGVFLVLLHSWWFVWVPMHQLTLLLPWYALQAAIMVWLVLWSRERLDRYRAEQPADDKGVVWLGAVSQFLTEALLGLTILALVEWTLHGLFVLRVASAALPPQWLIGGSDIIAAVLSGGLLLAAGIRQAWRSQNANWLYALAAWAGAIGLYVRLVWLGLAPLTVWDTTAVMAAAYGVFVLQRLTNSKPAFHLALLLPLLALGTIPLQAASSHASGALLSAGCLYLSLWRTSRQPLALYLTMLAFTICLYVWVPAWAQHSPGLHLYVAPAAISVLLLLHLHRHELRPSVLNSTRLATLSVLYSSASVDVFLHSDLRIFVIALALSLTGIGLGIVLRIRAFLYAGVAFFVLNIAGQLILLFPEQLLGRAIILFALGTLITGATFSFKTQREDVLERLRIFRADLAMWA